MITLLTISFAIFALYIISISLVERGVPHSISDSFYILNEKKRGLGYLFTIWCFVIAMSVMAVMFHLTDGERFQFIGLFTGGGLGFVGAAPLFKSHERTIHYTGATVCAVTGFAWMVLSGFWYVPVIALTAVIYPAHRDGKWTFWIELALFTGMYITLAMMLL
jgi:hypothetical protein